MVHASLEQREFSPRVTVLMATYNGRRWIEEQVNSILHQDVVSVRLVVSDDGSTDGTREFLQEWATHEPRILLLPQREGEPGVTANFLHLFTRHTRDGSFVAFSDQDDIWHPDKLIRQISLIESFGLDAVSSNVISFNEDGTKKLIRKSHSMRRWDFLFEAAGPGSTYVFSPRFHATLCDALEQLDSTMIGVHDWYLYALSRGLGARWRIDEHPTLDYRQHQSNVQGANRGLLARVSRLSRLSSGFYKDQFIQIASAVLACNTFTPAKREELSELIEILQNPSVKSRCAFAARWGDIRRHRVEGLQLAVSRLLHIW